MALRRYGLTDNVLNNEVPNQGIRHLMTLPMFPDNVMLVTFVRFEQQLTGLLAEAFEDFIRWFRQLSIYAITPQNFTHYGVLSRLNNSISSTLRIVRDIFSEQQNGLCFIGKKFCTLSCNA